MGEFDAAALRGCAALGKIVVAKPSDSTVCEVGQCGTLMFTESP
jgi:hypothetical protein